MLAQWWAPGDIKPALGHQFVLEMGPWGNQRCRVTAVEAPTTFAYTFGEGTLNTLITWHLEPDADQTLIHLEHSGFDLTTPAGRQAYEGMGRGWPGVLARIETALAPAENTGT